MMFPNLVSDVINECELYFFYVNQIGAMYGGP